MDKDKKSTRSKSGAWKNDRLKKKNYSVHCATSNWMILIEDGKARGYRMMNEKITKLDRLIFPTSQATTTEAARIMKKTKVNNEGWITIREKMYP